jgi:plastocyanin
MLISHLDRHKEKIMRVHAIAASAAILLGTQLASMEPAEAQSPEKRFFTVAAVEPKGGANIDREAFPEQRLPDGGGYVMKEPDETGRWEVASYLWMPSQIVVNQGDEVTLEFVGINGASHATEIEGIEKQFVLKRGHATQITFVAERPGVYAIICSDHEPSMRGEIVVLARND